MCLDQVWLSSQAWEEEARNIIKNVSMNALSRQRVFQDAASVVSEIHMLVGGTSGAEVLAQG